MSAPKNLGTISPVLIASLVNAVFFAFVVYLSVQEVSTPTGPATRWEVFLTSRPNEVGDTLAGVFGSMTLIWIVASVFQQTIELRAQRREFEEMVTAQEAQVQALEAQAETFRDERRRAEQKEQAAFLNNEIRRGIELYIFFDDQLKKAAVASEISAFSEVSDDDLRVNYSADNYRENDATLRRIVRAIKVFAAETQKRSEKLTLDLDARTIESIREFKKSMMGILETEPLLSRNAKRRLETLSIPALIDSLEFLERAIEPGNRQASET